MVERKKIAFLTKNPPPSRLMDFSTPEDQSRHYKVAVGILGVLQTDLVNAGFAVRHDDYPFHIVAKLRNGYNSWMYSIHCSGFDTRLDVQLLTPLGEPVTDAGERSFHSNADVIKFLDMEEIGISGEPRK